MESDINALTIINQHKSKSYFVGSTYNGLLLYRIVDESDCPYGEHITIIYRGRTEDGTIVFEVINAPIEIEYTKIPTVMDCPF